MAVRVGRLITLLGWLALHVSLSLPAMAGDVEAGEQLVQSKCVRCHAVAAGDHRPHPDAPPLAEAVRRYPPDTLAEAFAEGIVVGHPDMPEFVLAPEEIDNLLAYLDTLR